MLELKNICYTVSTPETGEQTILKDISVTIPLGRRGQAHRDRDAARASFRADDLR